MNNDKTPRCPDGWESGQLMAYVDGELDEQTAQRLENHVRRCPLCSRELDALQTTNALLTTFPEVFHPDAEELYRFAAQSHDPNGVIPGHLASCPQCREEVDLLRQMIVIGPETNRVRHAIPPSLRAKLESTYPSEPASKPRPESVLERFVSRFKLPFRPPVLALGTAAALAIMSVLLIQVWRGQINVHHPVAVSPPGEALPSRDSEITVPPSARVEKDERDRPAASTRRLGEDQDRRVSKTPVSPEVSERGAVDRDMEIHTGDTGKVAAPPAKRLFRGVVPRKKEEGIRAEPTAPQQGLGFRAGTERKPLYSDRERPSMAAPAPPQPEIHAPVPLKIRIRGAGELEIFPPQLTDARSGGLLVLGLRDYKLLALDQERIPRDATQVTREAQASFVPKAEDVPPGGYLVLINVRRFGDEYDVEAKLFGEGPELKKTIQEDHVGKGDLKDRIGGILASILESQS